MGALSLKNLVTLGKSVSICMIWLTFYLKARKKFNCMCIVVSVLPLSICMAARASSLFYMDKSWTRLSRLYSVIKREINYTRKMLLSVRLLDMLQCLKYGIVLGVFVQERVCGQGHVMIWFYTLFDFYVG